MLPRGSALTSTHDPSARRGKKCFHNCHRLNSQSSNKIALSDLCISNRSHASISDLCFSFEISISNLPVLTHWAERLVSQQWQSWPPAFRQHSRGKRRPVATRLVNNSTGDTQARRAYILLFSLPSDSAVHFEINCGQNLVSLPSQAFMPLKTVILLRWQLLFLHRCFSE